MKTYQVALLLITAWQISLAGGWSCRNEGLEVTCNKTQCKSRNDHTPMDVTIDKNKRLTFCAYSGCWVGRATIKKSGPYTIYFVYQLQGQNTQVTPPMKNLLFTLNNESRIGILSVLSYVTPMRCKR